MRYFKFFSLTSVAITVTFSLAAQSTASKQIATQSDIKLSTSTDTVQYSLGAYIGQWFQKNGFRVTSQAIFQRGIDDVLNNRKLAINDTVVAPLVASYQLSIQNAKSKALEESLFEALKGKAGVGVLPSGVHYMVAKTGTGRRPEAKDSVIFNTIGMFPDGTKFEDTYQKKQAIKAVPGNLIAGLNEAIQLMPEGSTWRIFIPSQLGYGSAGRPGIIPPNSALVFDVNLVQVKAQR
ncbi:MAG TPA: FKBP-type peptidyl-prolyl cis-trans isomerase [Bacteroidales bacterium]|nr:FKBP-type peptidyl-prolyl cis-trans isomerase [Bacteroidales bacterium]